MYGNPKSCQYVRLEKRRIGAAILLLTVSASLLGAQAPAESVGRSLQKHERGGIQVEFEVRPVSSGDEEAPVPLQGEPASVSFRITDASGNAFTGLRPAAWIDKISGQGSQPDDCRDLIQSFLNAGLGSRPAFDLNTYYILALNDARNISVIDPMFGYGRSKLLTAVRLLSPGEDWVLSADRNWLYVTMPEAGRLAVVNTQSWRVARNIEAGPQPTRIYLQDDGKYLWITNGGSFGGNGPGGVTVVERATLEVAARIATGPGSHQIAFDTSGRFAYVVNRSEQGTVSAIDVHTLTKVKDIPVGKLPSAIAFSELSRQVYAASEGDGVITVISGPDHEITSRITGKPGLSALRIAPGGRWGIVTNRLENTVQVFGTSSNEIVQTAPAGDGPSEIAFTGTSAHIRASGSSEAFMIAFSQLGQSGDLPVLTYTAGQQAPDRSLNSASAPSISPAPEGTAILVGNTADRTIYYYAEGMVAPMGSFKNYGWAPRAVMALDRGLKEGPSGTYQTNVQLTDAGEYQVAVLTSNPSFYHCFPLSVGANPAFHKANRPRLILEASFSEQVTTGENRSFQFRVSDRFTKSPVPEIQDMQVTVLSSASNWHARIPAEPLGDGYYTVSFAPPVDGGYQLLVESSSQRIRLGQLPGLVFTANSAVAELASEEKE
jgi:YVTN family beta-propeller protein